MSSEPIAGAIGTPASEIDIDASLDAPIDVEVTWIHGDLHPCNVLVEKGVITGVIDWGDITAGALLRRYRKGRATDLAAIWMLFSDAEVRQQAIATYANVSEATLKRARGWAVFFGVMLLDTGLVDNPRFAAIGEKTLRRIVEDS